jgi:hypothetical protein
MRLVVPLTLAALLGAGPAFAGEGCGSAEARVQRIFDSADADHSRSLDRAEYEGAGLQDFGASFEETDANGDGSTSLEEYLDLYDRTHPPVDRTDA